MILKLTIPFIMSALVASSSIAQSIDSLDRSREKRETSSTALLASGIFTTATLYMFETKNPWQFLAPAGMVATSIALRIPINFRRKPKRLLTLNHNKNEKG
jgi:hypothetical protein